ncbi:hypothetical protein RvY_17959 [Ramazzottius varieornatus]|uniref:Uncharacterized protein n=1 Tax=Ramazzottius varieornatus TaxID=947166 RepID=A0A1D1W414_RAMVA|nr:hypothetical protein RvY_17959 [Ramazzottius varieornatus]
MGSTAALLKSVGLLAVGLKMAQSRTWCTDKVYIDGCPDSAMDAKVMGIPWGQSWEDACGRKFQSDGLIGDIGAFVAFVLMHAQPVNISCKVWYCEKDQVATGIWLKGCGWAWAYLCRPFKWCGNSIFITGSVINYIREQVWEF